mmetsp:Transcript_89606/g.178148  ORF Transcript_89606/g.178148 Transcript_89606/m.178148 type:complete len:101 (+) Transcript_89606:433-735(+)
MKPDDAENAVATSDTSSTLWDAEWPESIDLSTDSSIGATSSCVMLEHSSERPVVPLKSPTIAVASGEEAPDGIVWLAAAAECGREGLPGSEGDMGSNTSE